MNNQFLLTPDNARQRMKGAWESACALLELGKRCVVTVAEAKGKRTLEQNNKMWAVLTDIANQVEWPVDGKLQKLTPEDWKDILTAGLRKEQRVAQGVEGGFVMLGQRTSKMTIGEMSDLIEFAHMFGAEHGVVWNPVAADREAA